MDRHRRRLTLLGLCLAVAGTLSVAAPAGIAGAGPGDTKPSGVSTSAGQTGDGATGTVTGRREGSGEAGSGGAARPSRTHDARAVTCRWNAVDAIAPLGSEGPTVEFSARVAGEKYWRSCFDTTTGQRVEGPDIRFFTPADAAQQAAQLRSELVETARANLVLDLPRPAFSPPNRTIPNIDTWLWTSGVTVESRSATAAGVTLSVTATHDSTTHTVNASPDPTRRSRDDGRSVTCPALSPVYDIARSAQPASPCSLRFHSPTRSFTVTTTTTWSLSWSASDGSRGDLGTIDRSAVTPYRVQTLDSGIRNA